MAVERVSGQGHAGKPSSTRKKFSVALPTKKSTPPSTPEGYTYFIYGEQKIGKTSLTTQFPSCLHVMFEPSGRDYELYEVQPSQWEEFLALIDTIENAKADGTLDFKTFALDTIDLCYDMCADFICKQNGVNHLSDVPFGGAYQQAEVEFRKAVERLARCGGFIALSHNKEREVETRTGKKYEVVMPSAQKKANLVLAKFCDLTGYYHIDDNGDHVLQIGKSADYESGNRMKSRFNYDDGTPMSIIPMGHSEEDAYGNFLKAFNNKFAKPKPAAKPTTEAPSVEKKQATDSPKKKVIARRK